MYFFTTYSTKSSCSTSFHPHLSHALYTELELKSLQHFKARIQDKQTYAWLGFFPKISESLVF